MSSFCPVFSQSAESLNDVKKEAKKLFDDEEYTRAYPLYSQLVANYPKDPEYNYRLGVCMIYSEPNKKKCIYYLKNAAANPREAPKDVNFFLGKAYHVNYLFDDAIKYFNDFKKTASASQQKKLQVDREISACMNGKHLLSNLSDLEVQSKKQLNETDYFRSYDLKNMGGKLIVKPDEFKTAVDRKKKDNSVIFLSKNGSVIYYSSYGENTDNGRDIYSIERLPGGGFGKPEKVQGINTEYDEDYPFLHPDGRTLYFSSKGHNSMGGYDIFRSSLIEGNRWGTPVNLEFPINSPDDDFLFVTDSLESTAYFSTGRQSPPGKTDVLRIKTERKPIDVLVIKGNVAHAENEPALASVINVKDASTGNAIGTYTTGEESEYLMELPNGANLDFTVETPGFKTQTENVSLPFATTSKPYRQTIGYEEGTLKIINYFDESTGDDNYLQYLKLIERKAKLEVNEGENKLSVPSLVKEETGDQPQDTAVASADKKVRPTIIEEKGAAPAKKPLNHKQLAAAAKQEAAETNAEAAQLRKDAADAAEVANKQKTDADKKLADADKAMREAEAMPEGEERTTAISVANGFKRDAENIQSVAIKMTGLADMLKEDAAAKEKKAILHEQYSKELERALTSPNGNQSLDRLDEIEKEIETLEARSNASDEAITAIKNDIEQKEKELSTAEALATDARNSSEQTRTAIKQKEEELAGTRKKSAKQQITDEITALKSDEAEQQKEITANETEAKRLSEEISILKSELALSDKIKTEDLAVEVPQPVAPSVPVAAAENKTATGTADRIATEDSPSAVLKEKYRDIAAAGTDKKTPPGEQVSTYKSYNSDIDQAVAKEKDRLAKTNDPSAKQRISNEIKKLEAAKQENTRQIALANEKKKSAEPIAESKKSSGTAYTPIPATSGTEALTLLENLSMRLDEEDPSKRNNPEFSDERARTLAQEADATLNELAQKQKQLKEQISAARNAIRPAESGNEGQPGIAQLNKEAEDLLKESRALRSKAATASGPQKEQLISEAKSLEEKATDKTLQASEITGYDNTFVFDNNKENIQALLAANKASEADAEEARKLNNEAELAFKQAIDIRVEALSFTNKAAKIGNASNAEEKEAEAILKQEQAVEILKRSNPGFSLKTAITSTTGTGQEASQETDLNTALEPVNRSISELAALKLASYQKLYEANQAETDKLTADINNNEVIRNNPRAKTDLIAAGKKISRSVQEKQKSETTPGIPARIELMASAIKLQEEAIQQLKAIAPGTSPVKEEPVAVTENTVIATQPGTVAASEPAATAKPAVIDAATAAMIVSAGSDTSTNAVLGYLDNNSITLKNQQAGADANEALTELKKTERENRDINNQIKRAARRNSAPEQLNAEASQLEADASELNTKVKAYKDEAEKKTGEERNFFIAKANESETAAREKLLDAAMLRAQSNENANSANAAAIEEMLGQLKLDDGDAAAEFEPLATEISGLRLQASNLRAEAAGIENEQARLAALSNAEEKESELIAKQNELLEGLKKEYPNYIVKTPWTDSTATTGDVPAELLTRKSANLEKQFSLLTQLTNAFTLEYETSKKSVPAGLNPQQAAIKKKADELNANSKTMLTRSAKAGSVQERITLLAAAARAGNSALEELSKISSIPVAGNGGAPPPPRESPAVKPGPVAPANKTNATVSIEGLEVIRGNAYSAAKPIPIDAKVSDGLIFRVQIGAFRTPIPDNAFKGLNPLNGETANNGFIRYTAGNFNKVENANAVKNDLRGLGYSDAFVVAYYNGKRISMAEALDLMKKEGREIDPSAPQSAGITANVNVPRAAVNAAVQEKVNVTAELEKLNGLLFTIQVGVYNKQVSKQQLMNLRPVFTEQLPNGMLRYTAGIYNNTDRLSADKKRVVDLGVKDAFISAYINGTRVGFGEARQRQANDPSIRMEPENPIVFPEGGASAAVPENTGVQPFSNGVANYPTPTPENGVKLTEEGICYKVQVGAYSRQVPPEVAAAFSAVKTWPVENKQVNGLYIYNIGNFSEARFAKQLKDELKTLGLNDAFITVYNNGSKLAGAEAATYLAR